MPYEQNRYFTPVEIEYAGGSVLTAPDTWGVSQDGDGWWFSGDEPGVGLFVRTEFYHLPEAGDDVIAGHAQSLVTQLDEYLGTQRLIEPLRRYRNGSARIIEAVLEFDEPDGRITRTFRWYVVVAADGVFGVARFFLNMPPDRSADPDMLELIEIVAPQPFRILTTPDDLHGPRGEKIASASDPWSKIEDDSERWPSHLTALVRHVFADSIELNIPRCWACEPPNEDSQELRCFDRTGGPGTFWVRWTKPARHTVKEAIEYILQEAVRYGDTILNGGITYLDSKAMLAVRQAPDNSDRKGAPLRTYAWDVAYETQLGPFVVTYALMVPEAIADEADFRELHQVLGREIQKTNLQLTRDVIIRTMIHWDDGSGGPTGVG